MDQFGCPFARNPHASNAGTGGPPDGTFVNLKTGATEVRKNGGNIQDEFVSEDSNGPATLSMANTGDPNTGGSQFFINVADNWRLDWFSEGPSRHPVFGRVIQGYDLCVRISQVETLAEDVPRDPFA